MRTIQWPHFVLAIALATAAACNSDGNGSAVDGGPSPTAPGGSAGAYRSGLPGNRQLSSLNQSEQDQICKSAEAHLTKALGDSKVTELGCRVGAVIFAAIAPAATDAELQAECKEVYDMCIKDKSGSVMGDCKIADSTCKASVAELEACYTTMPAYFEALGSAFPTCQQLTLQLLMSSSAVMPPMTSAACQALEAKCPGRVPTPEP